jgi:hypothetical protein
MSVNIRMFTIDFEASADRFDRQKHVDFYKQILSYNIRPFSCRRDALKVLYNAFSFSFDGDESTQRRYLSVYDRFKRLMFVQRMRQVTSWSSSLCGVLSSSPRAQSSVHVIKKCTVCISCMHSTTKSLTHKC